MIARLWPLESTDLVDAAAMTFLFAERSSEENIKDTKETRAAGGTGLGLHLTKHLVEAHDGTVWVESEIGVGSTFFVRLPIYPPRAKDEGYAFDEIE